MPKYEVLEKSFINNGIREAGEIIEFDGKPSSNLKLVSDGKLGVDREALKAELTAKGIEFFPNAKTEALQKLLDDSSLQD